jgi:hypothetical protein
VSEPGPGTVTVGVVLLEDWEIRKISMNLALPRKNGPTAMFEFLSATAEASFIAARVLHSKIVSQMRDCLLHAA